MYIFATCNHDPYLAMAIQLNQDAFDHVHLVLWKHNPDLEKYKYAYIQELTKAQYKTMLDAHGQPTITPSNVKISVQEWNSATKQNETVIYQPA